LKHLKEFAMREEQENPNNTPRTNKPTDNKPTDNVHADNVHADDIDSALDARLTNLRQQISVEIPHLNPPKIVTKAAVSRSNPVRRVLLVGTVAAASIAGISQRNVLFSSTGKGTKVAQAGSGSTETGTTTSAEPVAAVALPHWHAAFGVYVCNRYLPDRDGSLEPDATGVHLHDDGLIHVHPFPKAEVTGQNSEAGQTTETVSSDVTVASFLKGINVSFSSNEFTIPAYNDTGGISHPAATYKHKQPCAGIVSLYKFDKQGNATPITIDEPIGEDAIIALALLPVETPIPPPPSVASLRAPRDVNPPTIAPGDAQVATETVVADSSAVETEAPTDTEATETTETTVVATEAPPTDTADCAPKPQDVAAARKEEISVWNTPDESQLPSWTLGRPGSGIRTVFQVIDDRAGWVHVRVPALPNGATGWVRTTDVTCYRTPFGLTFNVTTGELTSYQDRKPLRVDAARFPAGVGSSATLEIPRGSFFLVNLLKSPSDQGNGFAFELSGFTNDSTHTRLRLRGETAVPTTDGRPNSGDIVISDEAMKILATTFFLGSPIDIQPVATTNG
jgi:hypothetical protein